MVASASVLLALASIYFFFTHNQAAWLALGLALAGLAFASWFKLELKPLPPSGQTLDGRLGSDALALLPLDQDLTPLVVWQTLENHWQTIFLCNHLLMPSDVHIVLSHEPSDMASAWQKASALANEASSPSIEPVHIAAGILLGDPRLKPVFDKLKILPDDIASVANWLGRVLERERAGQPFFGGIGRDWSHGYTPMLQRFGSNISEMIEHGGGHFGALTQSPGVKSIKDSFEQGAFAISLVGAPGIGKTSHVNALAQLLLEGKAGERLAYNQIIGLSPSEIISAAKRPGELEQIVLTLLREASHAGHIILFLDDADLFFSNGPGSFDVTHILQPIMQNGAVRLIMAMDPSSWQRLKAQNASFANLTTPVMLAEPPEAEVMRSMQDAALSLEHRRKVLIPQEGLREAYRLSGRYDQDNAYPGKALQLLQQSLPHPEHGNVITPKSVQDAIEQTRGVKAGAASGAEADTLLHLEDAIHQRMINQSHAVKVVAAALRRARAGVASPKRPIGSFLFLGPTGVGKTELSKAIAATYFNAEENMVRLDMSEYQQPDDVQRLLSDGQEDSMSLALAVRQQPFTVVLLDEIEKSHPNILNLLLQLLDEGELTDNAGRKVSFKDCIIICTSNAGADTIRQKVEQGEELETFQKEFTDQLINSGQFKPELLNRFDEIVLFRPLKPEELMQVVKLMMNEVNAALKNQNITVDLTDAATMKIVEQGNDPRLGARPMRRMLQRAVEDTISTRILSGQLSSGDHATLDVPDLTLES
jgi:ATP-dependent Clp protease ATP-binding subunit ClpC